MMVSDLAEFCPLLRAEDIAPLALRILNVNRRLKEGSETAVDGPAPRTRLDVAIAPGSGPTLAVKNTVTAPAGSWLVHLSRSNFI